MDEKRPRPLSLDIIRTSKESMYTNSPIVRQANYRKFIVRVSNIGSQSICIKESP